MKDEEEEEEEEEDNEDHKGTQRTNKQHQTTRFVRAMLRGLIAALRNLPTLDIVIEEEIREMELAGRND